MRSRATDGLLLVDKAPGMTSHDVVALARRALGERRIGHAGTLDPFATGLLVLLVGRATRLLPFVDGEPKVYEATIRFGRETTTDDCTGDPVREAPAPDDDAIRAALPSLTGEIEQLPPAFSAKQVEGQRAYAAARRGEALALRPARVVVHEWRLGAREGDDLHATIVCGGGTYIRALARDLGRRTGSAAHLAALRRVRSGRFDVADAIPIERLRAERPALRPPLEALGALPVEPLGAEDVGRVTRGIAVPAHATGERAALVDDARALVAVAERQGDRWQPRVVLRDA
ncbi:MAG TPA: tRNA pseudouridine(55) synthase TruB [Gemmatimonadaceae bacterium]